jgi:hypothetical protein
VKKVAENLIKPGIRNIEARLYFYVGGEMDGGRKFVGMQNLTF